MGHRAYKQIGSNSYVHPWNPTDIIRCYGDVEWQEFCLKRHECLQVVVFKSLIRKIHRDMGIHSHMHNYTLHVAFTVQHIIDLYLIKKAPIVIEKQDSFPAKQFYHRADGWGNLGERWDGPEEV